MALVEKLKRREALLVEEDQPSAANQKAYK
jgi:hypothetical protein